MISCHGIQIIVWFIVVIRCFDLNLFPFNFNFLKIINCFFFLVFGFYFHSHWTNPLVLPHINPFAFEEEANSGDSVQLTCHASKGDLPLTIKWLHNGLPMFSHLGVLTNKIGDRISLLTIPSVKDKNSGDYTCVAENAAGKTISTAKLYVNGE